MTITQDDKITVVGAGTMGAGIAQIAAQAGHVVQVIDAQAAALERGRETVSRGLAALVKRSQLSQYDADAIAARIGWSGDMAKVAESALVIEAIVERLDAKTGLFAAVAKHVGPQTILASNTSSLSIEQMAAQVSGPERFAGLHFFNPVPAMKLVELVPSSATANEVMNGLEALMHAWGKKPVRVKDVPGFIVNRVARPYYAEGFAAWSEGIEPEAVDHALEAAGGFRMGPLALADLIGHDINFAVARSVFEAYGGHTRFAVQPGQQALFDAGLLGRKNGKGVYDYAEALPKAALVDAAGASPPQTIEASHTAGAAEPLLALLVNAGLTVIRTPEVAADRVRVDGLTVALGDGRALSQRPDVAVLIDEARDWAATTTLVFSARNEGGSQLAAAMAAAVGKQALALPDRPGQLVLRTLAQLANSAYDALADDIADRNGIDTAMRFGANHPEGPLAWAARYGEERLAHVLQHIAQETGQAIYAPSPALLLAAAQ